MKSRTLGRQGVVVGDEVRVVGDVSGDEGSLARIVEVLERRTVLRRTRRRRRPDRAHRRRQRRPAGDRHRAGRPAARAPGLIDRCLVAAYDAGMEPLVCLTKSDLGVRRRDRGACSSRSTCASSITRQDGDLDVVRDAAARPHQRADRATAASASRRSSTPWCPTRTARSATSTRSPAAAATRRPRRSASSCRSAAGSSTPRASARSAWRTSTSTILISAFPDLNDAARDCPRGCTHLADEPECALDIAVADGEIDPARLESFRRIMASRSLARRLLTVRPRRPRP